MKLIFICSSLEAGRDGVGDYTRRLAAQLIRQGHMCRIMSLNDQWREEAKREERREERTEDRGRRAEFIEIQKSEGTGVECLRLPETMPWVERVRLAREWVGEFNPDWISLQFVPFGFHPKGLCFGLGKRLKAIAPTSKWHIMFHELWVGDEIGAVWKKRILGICQRQIIRSLIGRLHPIRLHTNVPVYRDMLYRLGSTSEVLPLISNIPFLPKPVSELKKSVPEFVLKNRSSCVIGTLFGSFYHQHWDLQSLLMLLAKEPQKGGKKMVVASLGHMSTGREWWEKLPELFPDIHFLTLGLRDAEFISYWLSEFTDFGIMTTPRLLAGKSGSYMAFKEHGLPVFCSDRHIELRFPPPECFEDNLMPVSLGQPTLTLPARLKPFNTLEHTASRFIGGLVGDRV